MEAPGSLRPQLRINLIITTYVLIRSAILKSRTLVIDYFIMTVVEPFLNPLGCARKIRCDFGLELKINYKIVYTVNLKYMHLNAFNINKI